MACWLKIACSTLALLLLSAKQDLSQGGSPLWCQVGFYILGTGSSSHAPVLPVSWSWYSQLEIFGLVISCVNLIPLVYASWVLVQKTPMFYTYLLKTYSTLKVKNIKRALAISLIHSMASRLRVATPVHQGVFFLSPLIMNWYFNCHYFWIFAAYKEIRLLRHRSYCDSWKNVRKY